MVRTQGFPRAVALVLAVTGLLGGVAVAPAPALAHDELTGTSPADGATVDTRLEEVTLTFSGVVRADGSTVTVTGRDGATHHDGPLSVRDRVVHQPVTSMGSGTYRVQWRVLAADGHPMTGEFAFTVALPPELEPAPGSTSTAPPTVELTATPPGTATDQADGGSTPAGWVIALVVAALVLALAMTLVLLRRRRGQP